MKLRSIFYLFSFCLLLVNVEDCFAANKGRVALSGNDIPFEIPVGHGNEHRSLTLEIPISAFIVDNNLIELDFVEAIGEIEITISQDGASIYSSSENILAPLSKGIQLSPDLSGNFLLEIRGANGACAYAWFAL